jgi:hypothetical protein
LNCNITIGKYSTACEIINFSNDNRSQFVTLVNSQGIEDNIHSVRAQGLHIWYLPRNFNEIFSNARDISIRYCQLKEISRKNLKSLTNLVDLDLSSNKIKKIPKNLFESNLKLRRINLNYNQIKFVHQDVFINLAHLEKLHFENNFCYDSYEDNVLNVTEIEKNIIENCNEDRKNSTLMDLTTVFEEYDTKKSIENVTENNLLLKKKDILKSGFGTVIFIIAFVAAVSFLIVISFIINRCRRNGEQADNLVQKDDFDVSNFVSMSTLTKMEKPLPFEDEFIYDTCTVSADEISNIFNVDA